jgi:hypothetical protein
VAVRVDRETFDPASVASGLASGVNVYEDGVPANPWQPRPFASKTEFITSEALRLMVIPAEVIRQTRPVVPQQLFPPVDGYDHTPLGIDDVLDTNRWEPQYRSWVSGVVRKPRQVDNIEDMWSGTLRGFNSSPNPAG